MIDFVFQKITEGRIQFPNVLHSNVQDSSVIKSVITTNTYVMLFIEPFHMYNVTKYSSIYGEV